jgi:hypothetical protein
LTYLDNVKVPQIVSMSYGKADMEFIHEATGIQKDQEVWENIPIDENLNPSETFVNLFKQNCKVFEFNVEASRRIVIDLFLREIVSEFPPLMVVCEYHMTQVNESKRRRLNGNCDYTICHRGLRNRPHLVAIEAKMLNHESLLQCIGECASIYYQRKQEGMRNKCVYGIHSTGSSWIFIHIAENGLVSVTKEYQLNAEDYNKEEFDRIFRLIHYVVQQSYNNSARTTPNISLENLV